MDTDHDPGPEARLLSHIPPSSAHPHLDRYLGGHSVFSSSSSFSLTTTFRSLCGRSLKILSRTSAGNVLLIHPAAILASHFWNSIYLDLRKVFSWRIKFWTCLYPWTDHLTPAVPVPHFAHSTMVERSSSDIWPTWPEPWVRPEYLKSDLTDDPTCWHLTRWPSDLLTSDLFVWLLDHMTSWPSDFFPYG